MNGYMGGYNGYCSFMPQNSQAKTDNYPSYVFTYVAPTSPSGFVFIGQFFVWFLVCYLSLNLLPY